MSFFREKPEKYRKERRLYDDFNKPRTFDNINLEDNDEKQIKEIFEISKAEISNIEKYYENSLQNFLVTNFEERLKRVATNENKNNAALQKEIFVDLRAYLMDSYSIEGNKMSKANRKQLLKNCVEQLKTCY